MSKIRGIDISIIQLVICWLLLLLCVPNLVKMKSFFKVTIKIFWCKHLKFDFLTTNHFIKVIKQIHLKGCYLNLLPSQYSHAKNPDFQTKNGTCKSEKILMLIRILKNRFSLKIHKAKVFAKSSQKINIICLTFLKIKLKFALYHCTKIEVFQ